MEATQDTVEDTAEDAAEDTAEDVVQDAEQDVEEDAEEVDMAKEEGEANITPTNQQSNMDLSSQKQECTPKSSGWNFLMINVNQ